MSAADMFKNIPAFDQVPTLHRLGPPNLNAYTRQLENQSLSPYYETRNPKNPSPLKHKKPSRCRTLPTDPQVPSPNPEYRQQDKNIKHSSNPLCAEACTLLSPSLC